MVAHLSQPAVLAPPPAVGRSLTYRLALPADPRAAIRRLAAGFDPEHGAIGLSATLVRQIGGEVPGLRGFPALSGTVAVPSTQHALWAMLRGADRSEIFDRAWSLADLLGGDFILADCCDTFVYAGGRDLTGYEDGTENPQGDAAVAAALVPAGRLGLSGSSFAAVQRWVHDLRHFHGHAPEDCDAMIGRERDSNEEMDGAPPDAHVKMAAQESYEPAAFMLRRSMPWAGPHEQGLEFIAYGSSLDAYERVLRRMTGVDGGLTDALFRFSRPVTGGYYWCPPIADGRLDLRALGL